jgi:dipeptidyl aminopeptidase/acylaminoacyl peptidase
VWAFDTVAQFLATRGYAVLQPNFRGSTGFGPAFTVAGYRQWGRAMQDDLTDGVRWLAAQGRVDAKRVCIGGASYGGYAAVMAVVREPALFRCAIDLYGPTDLTWVVDLPEVDYNWHVDRDFERTLKELVGDPDDPAQRPAMDAHSPRLVAPRIKAPLLLVYGSDDRRVPVRHGTALRDAVKEAGGDVEWRLFTGEGHGVRDTRNRAEMLHLIERFLARHVGTASVPQ